MQRIEKKREKLIAWVSVNSVRLTRGKFNVVIRMTRTCVFEKYKHQMTCFHTGHLITPSRTECYVIVSELHTLY